MGVKVNMGLMAMSVMIILVLSHGVAAGTRIGSRKDLALERRLKLLNKPAVKTIQSEDGDIIDCVDIYKQPAFDHPALKNHILQMKPCCDPKGVERKGDYSAPVITQIWQKSGSCPVGTVPIRRIRKRDLVEAISAGKSFGKKPPSSFDRTLLGSNNQSIHDVEPQYHHYGTVQTKSGEYYGTKATINVWNPQLESRTHFSLAQFWLVNTPGSDTTNSIEVGWTVNPSVYGDYQTRMFTYWTADGYHHTGCYDNFCPGFVQLTNEISLGTALTPISTYNGSQYQVTFHVYKDQNTGNWFLEFVDKNVLIGYWPSIIFKSLGDSASIVSWGGEVFAPGSGKPHTTTQMGSGHFPVEGFTKASWFINVQVVDDSHTLKDPSNLITNSDQPNCYDVDKGRDSGDASGYVFYYGGPGRNPMCP